MQVGSIIKAIGVSWLESLSVFLPKNFKIFSLITIKSIIRTTQALIFGAWPFLILYGIFAIWVGTLFYAYQIVIENTLFVFLILAAARPSTSLKNIRYFAKKFTYYFIPFCGLVIFSMFFNRGLFSLGYSLSHYIGNFFGIILITYAYLFFYQFFAFLILFMFDTDIQLKSLLKAPWRALKIFVYNFPFCFLLASFVGLGSLLITILSFDSSHIILWSIVSYVLSTFWLIILTNFYVKRLHEQNRVYYEI